MRPTSVLLLFSTLLTSGALSFAVVSELQSAVIPNDPYGGRGEVLPCTCSVPNQLIIIGPPTPTVTVYTPASQIYEYQQVATPGVWHVGLNAPPAPCLIWAGKVCVPIAPQPVGSILIDGTSLPGV